VVDGGSEFVVLHVRDGELDGQGSWVYAWVGPDAEVVYVGATGLDPRARVWLHLHDDDPDLGRMRARFPSLAEVPLAVLAMRLPDGVARAEVRDVLAARLGEEGRLGADAITDHLQLVLDPSSEAIELAERFVARLRSDRALRHR
jgi:hypothetical protein